MNNWLKAIFFITILIWLTLTLSPSPSLSQSPSHDTRLQIETIVNMGIIAGNGATPKHLALNNDAELLYILTEGVPILKQGNGLSVYDLNTGQIVEHISLNQGDNEALDLHVDSTTGLIYVLWKERYSDTRPTLTVIDSQLLQVEQTILNVEALTATDGQLYAANAQELFSVNLSNNSLGEAQRLNLSPATANAAIVTGPMAVSKAANRLYLGRNVDGLWQMEIFEADTLMPVATYPFDTDILNIMPLPNQDQVLVIAASGSFRAIYRLTTDGELADLPYELGSRYGAAGIALSQDQENLYFSNGETRPYNPTPTDTTGPALIGLSSGGNLSSLHNIPLPTNVDDLAIHDDTQQAFALYPFDDYLYVIDLAGETVNIVHTAINIQDVLVDTEANQIFVSDSAYRIRRLDAESYEVLAEIQLTTNAPNDFGNDYGFKSVSWSGELTLDQGRNRLYVSGLPAFVLNADTLTEVGALEPGGQLAPDPTSDNIYISNCGVTILKATTLSGDTLIPGSGSRPDGLSPNPCVGYSRLDPINQWLYSLAPNGVPGSNGGSYLYVYDLSLKPTVIFSDTDITIVDAEPDPTNQRAFVNYVRHSNKRLRTLAVSNTKPATYTHHLMGLWGNTRYNPTTNHLYLSDRTHNRLLTLDADTLSILDELTLPAKYNYRLVDLDPNANKLYMIGLDGQLLIASPDTGLIEATSILSPPQEPTGDIMALTSAVTGTLLARIESVDDDTPDTHLYRSQNDGQSWLDLSQTLPNMPVQTLAVANENSEHPTLFAGLLAFGQTGGLYKSIDDGQTWTPSMAGLQDLWVEELFISPNFEQTGLIFAQTTHAGLHQSTDGGQSWTPVSPLSPNDFFPTAGHSTAVAFDNQDAVLISQSLAEMTGIFRAALQQNGSLSAWEQVLDVAVDHLAFSPDGQTVLAANSELWRSTDGGQRWQASGAGITGVENLQPDHFLFSPTFAQNNTVYLFFKDISGNLPTRLFRSQDGGQSWQAWQDPISEGNHFTALTLASTGNFIFGDNTTQLTQLPPSALTWIDPEDITTPFPLDDLALSTDVDNPTLFALSREHGLFKSTNSGQQWQLTAFPARTYGFSLLPYHLALSPTYQQDQTLFIATGRSLHRSTDGGKQWEQLSVAKNKVSTPSLSFKAQRVALSPNFATNQTVLVSVEDAVYRSTNGGDTWQEVIKLTETAGSTDVLRFTPDGDTVYARFGYGQSLFTSLNGGQRWQEHQDTTEAYLSINASAITTDGTLTAAVEFSARLLQTDAQSPSWREISQAIPSELTTIETLAYGPHDTLYVGGQGGIFVTQDDGQNWRILTSPSATTNITHLSAINTHLIAASTEGNIFISNDNGDSWTDISVVK